MRALPLLLLAACFEYGFGKPEDGSGTFPGSDAGSPGADTTADNDGGDTSTGGDTTPGGDDSTGGGGDDTATTTPGDDTGPGGGEPDCEEAKRTTGYLDGFQRPGDGKVVFCHRQGGPNYVIINTDIDACLPHLDHDQDVFPTSGCDS